MADEQLDQTTAPEQAPVADPAPAPEAAAAPADPAAAVTPDPSSPSTSSDATAPPSGEPAPAPPVTVTNFTPRDDTQPILGSWVDVVSGEYSGRFGAYVADVAHDPQTGYPHRAIVRTRDADNLLIEVDYADLRPSARNGGR